MVLLPTDYLTDASSEKPFLEGVKNSGRNAALAPISNGRIVAQKSVLSSTIRRGASETQTVPISGFTLFVNGIQAPLGRMRSERKSSCGCARARK